MMTGMAFITYGISDMNKKQWLPIQYVFFLLLSFSGDGTIPVIVSDFKNTFPELQVKPLQVMGKD